MLKIVLVFSFLWPAILFADDSGDSGVPNYEVEKLKLPFPGYLYKPKTENQSYPAIVLLHGSEGGNGDFWYTPGNRPKRTGEGSDAPWRARRYAKLGYVALALCYFDCRHHKGLSDLPPDELVKVDIKGITQKAIAWLRQQKFVGNNKVGLLGMSRGAEQAILLASLSDPDSAGTPDAVVSLSPSDQVMGQFSKRTAEAIIRGDTAQWPLKPAWMYGNDTPALGYPIQVEKYKNPLLVTYFWIDPVWMGYEDLSSTMRRFEVAGVEYFYKKIGRQNIGEKTFQSISSTSSKAIFIKYDISGHVYPDRTKDPAVARLHDKTIDWFLNKYLRN